MAIRLSSIMLLIATASMSLLVGCAGTASGQRATAMKANPKVQLVAAERPRSDALVVIRYPAMVEADAENTFYRAFESKPIGGKVPPEKQFSPNTERVAKAVIAKSNYFAMSLYRELQAKLPERTVLLSPHVIQKEGATGLTSKPVLEVEEIPAAITVDYAAYSFPDSDQMMDAPPLTFGDIATSLLVIRTDRWASPTTHGLLLASDPLVKSAWVQAKAASAADTRQMLTDAGGRSRPLDFVYFLTNEPSVPAGEIPLSAPGSSSRAVAIKGYPVEKVKMDPKKVAVLSTDNSADPFAESFAAGAATRIVGMLNTTDPRRATVAARHRALASFDAEVAGAQFGASDNESVRARLQLAERIIGAQRDFLAVQSRKVYEGTYDGDFGRKAREMMVAEHELLQKRRSLAREQNVGMFMAVLGAAAAGYGSASAGSIAAYDPVAAQSLMNSSTSLMMQSMIAATDAAAAGEESKALGENFLVAMAPAISEQISVRVESLDGSVEVTAKTFGEFKTKTMTLYQQQVRSIEGASVGVCALRLPAIATPGQWYGQCEEGLAAGTGYGVVLDPATEMPTEYLGAAQNGAPAGVGQMIISSASGVTAYEGQFVAGQPEGAVLVSVAGKAATARQFQAGKDIGRADQKLVPRLAI